MSGHPQGESVIGRRALVVGVQTYLDPGIHTRPGTSAALRQLGGAARADHRQRRIRDVGGQSPAR